MWVIYFECESVFPMLPFLTSKALHYTNKTPYPDPTHHAQQSTYSNKYYIQPHPPATLLHTCAYTQVECVFVVCVCVRVCGTTLLDGKYYTFRKVLLTKAWVHMARPARTYELKLVLIGNLVNFKPIYMRLYGAWFVYTPRSD